MVKATEFNSICEAELITQEAFQWGEASVFFWLCDGADQSGEVRGRRFIWCCIVEIHDRASTIVDSLFRPAGSCGAAAGLALLTRWDFYVTFGNAGTLGEVMPQWLQETHYVEHINSIVQSTLRYLWM